MPRLCDEHLCAVDACFRRLRHVQNPRQQRIPGQVAKPPASQEVQLHEVVKV